MANQYTSKHQAQAKAITEAKNTIAGSGDATGFQFPFRVLTDDKGWSVLATNAGIADTAQARRELESIIKKYREKTHSLSNKKQGEMKSLVKEVDEIIARIKEITNDPDSERALHIAGLMRGENKSFTIANWNMCAALEARLKELRQLREWLDEAAKQFVKGKPGPDDTLSRLVSSLYQWSLDFGGIKWKRSSTIKRGSNTEKYINFVVQVAAFANLNYTQAAVNEAIKKENVKREGTIKVQ